MAEVKIEVIAEDRSGKTFSAVEQAGRSAFDRVTDSAVTGSSRIQSALKGVEQDGKRSFEGIQKSATALFNTWESGMAKQTALDSLGIKSTSALDAQKAAVNSAYEQIKTSAVATNDEIVRAEAARGSAIEKIDRENFANRKSLLDNFKAHWLAITAAIYAAWEVVSQALDFMKIGAQAIQAEESYRRVTAAYGEDGDKLLQKMGEVSRGMIDESDLMQKAVKSLQQHLSGQQIVQLLELSRYAARNAGSDVKSAFEGITTAVENQAVKGLKLYGIVIDQARAFETYAQKIGISKDALTEEQQTQALVNAVLEEGSRQMKAHGEIAENAFEKYQKGQAQMNELKETIGKGLLVVVQFLGGVMYLAAAGAMELAAGVLAIVGAASYLLGLNPVVAFTSIGESLRNFGRGLLDDAKTMHDAVGETAAKGVTMIEGLGAKSTEATIQVSSAVQSLKTQVEIATAAQAKLKTTTEANIKTFPLLAQAISGASESIVTFAGDRLSQTLAATTMDLDKVRTGYKNYMETIDEVAARQIQYQRQIKTALGTEALEAGKLDRALSASLVQAVAKQQTEILTVEQTYAQTRLQAYSKYYDELKKLHSDALKEMADKIREQAELEKTLLATRQSAADLTFDLQKKLMSPMETFYATLQRNEEKYAQAMTLTGKSKIDALEEYKRAVSATAIEVKEGDKVVITLSDAVVGAIERIATAQQAIETEAANMAVANENALNMIRARVIDLESEMQNALVAVDALRQQIISLDAQISANRVLEIDVSQASASLARLQSQLASVMSVAAGAGSVSISAVNPSISRSYVGDDGTEHYIVEGSYASGTRYVPRTGYYQLHQGEEVLNPRESMQSANQRVRAADVLQAISNLSALQNQISSVLTAAGVGSVSMSVVNPKASSSHVGDEGAPREYFHVEGSYASGTRYVPRTGIYQLHQGEEVKNQRESMQTSSRGNSAAPISISIPSITVIAREGDDPKTLARKLAKPMRDELQRLQQRQ